MTIGFMGARLANPAIPCLLTAAGPRTGPRFAAPLALTTAAGIISNTTSALAQETPSAHTLEFMNSPYATYGLMGIMHFGIALTSRALVGLVASKTRSAKAFRPAQKDLLDSVYFSPEPRLAAVVQYLNETCRQGDVDRTQAYHADRMAGYHRSFGTMMGPAAASLGVFLWNPHPLFSTLGCIATALTYFAMEGEENNDPRVWYALRVLVPGLMMGLLSYVTKWPIMVHGGLIVGAFLAGLTAKAGGEHAAGQKAALYREVEQAIRGELGAFSTGQGHYEEFGPYQAPTPMGPDDSTALDVYLKWRDSLSDSDRTQADQRFTTLNQRVAVIQNLFNRHILDVRGGPRPLRSRGNPKEAFRKALEEAH